jgi:hypothetical protein
MGKATRILEMLETGSLNEGSEVDKFARMLRGLGDFSMFDMYKILGQKQKATQNKMVKDYWALYQRDIIRWFSKLDSAGQDRAYQLAKDKA